MWQRANFFSLLLMSFFACISFAFVFLTHFSSVPKPSHTEAPLFSSTNDVLLGESTENSKDLWMNKNGKRLHYHLESPTARILLKHLSHSFALVEELDEMRLWMQSHILSTSS